MARPIVLVHGMWCTNATLERLRALLAERGYSVHVPDLPAHQVGQVDAAVGPKSLREYVDFLERYVAEQNFKVPPVLVGHSMGGLLAQQLAARIQPFALVLLTPASPSGILALSGSNIVAFWRVFTTPGFWRKAHKPSRERCAASVYNQTPRERHDRYYATLVPESGRAVFEIGFWPLDRARAAACDHRAIVCPVYVVSAGHDKLTPAGIVRKVAALYGKATLRHYPARGHWVIDDEDTEEMVNEILGWLRPFEARAERLGTSHA
jgi:pimeloyl-ACP methyl ester carboxylesterase